VVDLHGPRVDVGLERVEGVCKIGNAEGHCLLLSVRVRSGQGYAPRVPAPPTEETDVELRRDQTA
jgi:hypothetical protein